MKKILNIALLSVLMFATFSCSSNDDEDGPAYLNRVNVQLYANETEQLKYSLGDCSWRSGNSRIASVDGNGLVTAHLVGTTKIFANSLSCQVTVVPRYTMYSEPYMVWGASKSEVRVQMSGYKALTSDDDNMLIYEGKGKTLAYLYQFENGKLTSCAFAVSLYNSLNIVDFLRERYVPVGEDENTYMCSTPDMKTAVGVRIENSVMVAYMPLLSDSKALVRSGEIEPLFKKLGAVFDGLSLE